MNGRQWKDEIAVMTNFELEHYEFGLNKLKNWESFEREFGCGASLATLRGMISNERTSRIVGGFIPEKKKFDLYKTAKVKTSAPVEHAGEFVKVTGHVNETLVDIEFINGESGRYHKCHLERFCL